MVNRHNSDSIAFYKNMGLESIRNPIGAMMKRVFKQGKAGAQAGIPKAVFPLRAQRRPVLKRRFTLEGAGFSALPLCSWRRAKTATGIGVSASAVRTGQNSLCHGPMGFRIDS